MVDKKSIIENMSLEKTLGTIPSGLFVVDTEMKIVYWNPAAERITGYSVDDAVGRHCSFLEGAPCDDGCGLFDLDKPKPIIGAQCTIITKNGDTIHLLKNMEFLRDADGNIIGGIESFIDVTRQNSLESTLREQAITLEKTVQQQTNELRKSETLFRSVLDNMGDLAYIVSEDYLITFMNQAMKDRFGDRVGDACFEVLHEQKKICPWCPLDKVLSNRTLRDERIFCKDSRQYDIIHSPLPEEGGLKRKLAICRDITERKQAESDLKEANRELDAFAHSISHDLRGILAPVVTYMDFLRITYAEVFDVQIMQILAEVERQSERAIALLDDLLDLAQISHVKPEDKPTDVNMIIDEIIHETSLDDQKLHEIKVDELPATWVPETLVYQLFSNLINNARLYVPIECGAIEIGFWEENNSIIYFVRDHGPGVSYNESREIFDIFYRGKSSKGQRGTGVGLAIVRKIALRCQGEAWVEQTPDGGATFCVSLPRVQTSGVASSPTT